MDENSSTPPLVQQSSASSYKKEKIIIYSIKAFIILFFLLSIGILTHFILERNNCMYLRSNTSAFTSNEYYEIVNNKYKGSFDLPVGIDICGMGITLKYSGVYILQNFLLIISIAANLFYIFFMIGKSVYLRLSHSPTIQMTKTIRKIGYSLGIILMILLIYIIPNFYISRIIYGQ
jgi:hypothetical protein